MYGINSNSEQFLASIELLQARQARIQNQITSGIRVAKASDDPSAVSDILSLSAEIRSTAQVKSNLNQVKTEVDVAESSLQSAVQLLQNAATLATQGASTLTSKEQRVILATQVGALLEQMVGLSRTQVAGRFIFSGDLGSVPSYQVNLDQPNGVDRLVKPSSTHLIQDTSGITFSPAETALSIFDRRNADDSLAADNTFAALNQLRSALLDDTATEVGNALAGIKTAQDSMNQHLAFYGGVQNRVAAALTVADTYQVMEDAALGQLRDTDITAAALESIQVQTNLTAAMSSQARLPSGSLFDYLK